jgi:hypothetical protein
MSEHVIGVMNKISEDVRRDALDHLKSGAGIETVVRQRGRVGRPIPVEHPRGSITHWFVPVAIDERLAGYLLFDAKRELRGYSSFLRGSDTVEGAPDLGSWTDPEVVLKTAAKSASGRIFGEPYMTYDGVPSRLAWAVPIQSEGGPAVLYVAGEHMYTRPHGTESTG